MRLPSAALGLAVASAAVLGACNEHVFRQVELRCNRTLVNKTALAAEKAADILIVVDNSGSMCEEQENLAKNFFDPACPLTDLNNIPDQFKNPNDATITELSKSCGFIQMLAAFDNDFHVGVITTDVGNCDNRFKEAELFSCGAPEPDWGNRPQRGCLQAPPGSAKHVFARADTDIGERFQSTLQNIKTFGSAVERGFDAAQIFLDPASTRAPGCEDDLAEFLRPDAKLSVIFLSDEEDCSHEGVAAFKDENIGEICTGDAQSSEYAQTYNDSAKTCYASGAPLAAVDTFVNFFKSLKADPDDVQVAVIAGAIWFIQRPMKSPGESGAASPAKARMPPQRAWPRTTICFTFSACTANSSVTRVAALASRPVAAPPASPRAASPIRALGTSSSRNAWARRACRTPSVATTSAPR